MVLTEAELGYLAGLVDSEGCINITCQQKRYYVLQVIIAQGNEPLLTHWQERTKLGAIHPLRRKKNGNTNRSWQWHLNHSHAALLLHSVMPYLILKKEEARISLEFIETCKVQSTQYKGKGTPRITEDMIKSRQAYKDALHQLKRNRHGKAND